MFAILSQFLAWPFATGSNAPLIADPKILAIPVSENNEPLVDLRDTKSIRLGPSPEIDNNQDYYHVRKTVDKMLAKADQLLPKGLHLQLYEGYRSLALQSQLFQGRYAIVQKQHPDWSHEKLFTETSRLVSPVTNLDGSQNVPPHATGGAVDVYLVDDSGEAVDMGIHPKDWMQDHNGEHSLTHSSKISALAKQNRSIMSRVLKQAGFVNYPHEFWHWSYGDRYWAYYSSKAHSLYDAVTTRERALVN